MTIETTNERLGHSTGDSVIRTVTTSDPSLSVYHVIRNWGVLSECHWVGGSIILPLLSRNRPNPHPSFISGPFTCMSLGVRSPPGLSGPTPYPPFRPVRLSEGYYKMELYLHQSSSQVRPTLQLDPDVRDPGSSLLDLSEGGSWGLRRPERAVLIFLFVCRGPRMSYSRISERKDKGESTSPSDSTVLLGTRPSILRPHDQGKGGRSR